MDSASEGMTELRVNVAPAVHMAGFPGLYIPRLDG